MSGNIPLGPAPDSPAGVRPLPPKPSLEYERKRAKRLLAALRRGDPAALTHAALHDVASSGADGGYQLANAQFVIAREYGFRSWPRLVEYFTILERHERSEREPTSSPPGEFERRAQSLVAQHRGRSPAVASMVVSYVPRFFRLSLDDALNSEMTLDDAKLVLARQHLCTSWDALLELSAHSPKTGGWEHYEEPLVQAHRAIRTGDLPTLAALVEAHPELLERREGDYGWGWPLILSALSVERTATIGRPQNPPRPLLTNPADARRLTDWLISRGADAQGALNHMLLGYAHRMERMEPADVEFLLARGADPEWMPANEITVLEHALYRYGNGAAVDVLASRVTPRRSFWIAAGLGDVRSLERYLDRTGHLSDSARRSRPDLRAMGRPTAGIAPSQFRDDDHAILWEAFYIAAINSRWTVMDRIVAAGLPVDYHADGWTLLQYAVGLRRVPLVEYLVSRGARPDVRYVPEYTPRTIAELSFRNSPTAPGARRMLELCGGADPDTLLKEIQRESNEVKISPQLLKTLERARADAARRGQSAVEPLDVFVAILRDDRPELPLTYLWAAGVDVRRLRELLAPRLVENAEGDMESNIPPSEETRRILDAARTSAEERRRQTVHALTVLGALAGSDVGAVADLIRAAGSTPSQLREVLANA